MATSYEITVLTTPFHHHYLNVDVPDGITDNILWIDNWLKNTEFAGARIINLNREQPRMRSTEHRASTTTLEGAL
jgi:hypothetical protein